MTPQTSIGIDNQARITGMTRYKHSAGQTAVDYARDLMDRLIAERGIQLTIRWTPGHCNIEGNEAADVEAKTAADGPQGSTDAHLLPPFATTTVQRSVAAMHQAFKARTRRRAVNRWRRSKRYNRMKTIDNTMPSNRFLKLVHTLPRSQLTILIWLRTGHIPLNHHLHRIKAVESPGCEACQTETKETTRHYLLGCPAYKRARRELQKKIGHRKAGSIPYLLSNPDATQPLMAYVDGTKQFAETLVTLVVPLLVWPAAR
jgi:hypothetical protein